MDKAPCPPAKNNFPASIVVEELTKRFGNFTAVDQISFTINKTEIFGFLGPNGAGKSTTIKMLCGILTPTSGKGTVAGFDIKKQPENIRKHIGYMSQKFSLYSDLTAEDNIDFFGGVYGVPRKEMKARKDEIFELVGLTEKRHLSTALLTGGWRQRLALACALIHKPPVVFLDEPTSGVDPISRRDFWAIIQTLSQKGITVLVTTHYMEEAEYCQRLALISSGKLIACGAPRELKESFGYRIFYIECSDLSGALQVMQKDPAFVDASLWGPGVHVVTSSGEDARGRIREDLNGAGIEIKLIRPALVTLEDVFVFKVKEGQQ